MRDPTGEFMLSQFVSQSRGKKSMTKRPAMNAVDVLRNYTCGVPEAYQALDRLARLVDECKRLEWVSGRDEFEEALADVLGEGE